ncbi:hypothetical protein PC129_g5246 [Phytophthora cactorum]|uniref:Uncharacterized protein n=2 Tax=Phytophthora cactorum TaxID=29920 RepID=A0A329SFK3_9STRA|nr:hypothetical protein Pcac1_g21129 [Phytophthora cactorum]KAG2834645.1 hypothetical protein PC111_g5747 [Phytophthora cactorum]KAG2837550.1 hypothetical protein PC112_g4868 [Phytophthora cactorum]KAG2922616.1 hypothetical protein PC114_g5196 [Phytophthora cactorum]KAG2943889.1 hypothetical protein PC115_g557 [Phytophthora cactorum]
MWVVDHGTCAIHMDDKPHRFLPNAFPKRERPSSDQQNDSDEQGSESTTEERPKKRTRLVVDSSTTCAPEQLNCRYANKKCLNPRAVKRTGGLHTFCAMHRANANRNQRRLDMRKRMARQALRAQAEAGQASPFPDATTPRQGTALKTEAMSPSSPPGQYDSRFEPLQTPTPLQEEDISTLVTLFLPSETTFDFYLNAPMTPTAPHDWSSSTSTGGRTPPPPQPPSGGMRF